MKIAKLTFWAAAALAVSTFSACNTDSDPTPIAPPDPALGIYVLNQGNASNGSLGYFQLSSGNYIPSVNDGQPVLNGEGRDLLRYGNKLYILVDNGSGKVMVVNAISGNVLESLVVDDPRHLTAYKGRVYVSHGENNISAIDTSTMSIAGTVNVGNTPEHLTAFRNRLYVSNSGARRVSEGGAYDNRISVIDISSGLNFERHITIEGAANLRALVGDSISNTLLVNADATYAEDGSTVVTPSKLYTIGLDANSINSSISFGTENLSLVYSQGQPVVLASSSNRSNVAGQHEYLFIQNLSNLNVSTNFFQNTVGLNKPTSIKFVTDNENFSYILIGNEKTDGSGEVYAYFGNGQLAGSFSVTSKPVGFAPKN